MKDEIFDNPNCGKYEVNCGKENPHLAEINRDPLMQIKNPENYTKKEYIFASFEHRTKNPQKYISSKCNTQ